VLERYDLLGAVPPAVLALLRSGCEGALPETLKAAESQARGAANVIVGSDRTALGGAATAAKALGWQVFVESTPLAGDSTDAARAFAARLRELRASQGPAARRCVLAGGETTVRVRGTGRGGRNQEFALAMASEIAGQPITVLSAGTDGVDGPTDAAGAFVDGTTMQRATGQGLDAATALADNDSYTFFARVGDLFRSGPTGTNVMDIKIALVGG
jgi:glycerate 2-kinase